MMNALKNKEIVICNIILSMDRPFKISQLFDEMAGKGINDRDKILEVLDQLCDSGIIRYSEVEDDQWAYKNTLQLV
ncbi:MAG: hypothetical protein J6C64_00660 [Lachnospiraceae bacterium]|nr:hypothetical protein [Lachnospiraceae bacterium]